MQQFKGRTAVVTSAGSEIGKALADAAWERFGAVHLLCNNAGIVPARVSVRSGKPRSKIGNGA